MTAGVFRVNIVGRVANAVIDHPPNHLVDASFVIELATLVDRLEAESLVRVLVFSSADPDFFLMHGDVDLIRQLPVAGSATTDEVNFSAALFDRIRGSSIVTLGLLDGIARGGGCEFLASLDIRVGSHRAVVGQPEVALDLIPGAGGCLRWPRMVGRGRALDILLTGRDVTAEEAYQIGWLDRVVATDDLERVGTEIAQRIAAMPTEAVTAIKRVVDLSLGEQQSVLLAESLALQHRLADESHRDAIERFLFAGGQTREAELPEQFALVLERTIQAQRGAGSRRDE